MGEEFSKYIAEFRQIDSPLESFWFYLFVDIEMLGSLHNTFNILPKDSFFTFRMKCKTILLVAVLCTY